MEPDRGTCNNLGTACDSLVVTSSFWSMCSGTYLNFFDVHADGNGFDFSMHKYWASVAWTYEEGNSHYAIDSWSCTPFDFVGDATDITKGIGNGMFVPTDCECDVVFNNQSISYSQCPGFTPPRYPRQTVVIDQEYSTLSVSVRFKNNCQTCSSQQFDKWWVRPGIFFVWQCTNTAYYERQNIYQPVLLQPWLGVYFGVDSEGITVVTAVDNGGISRDMSWLGSACKKPRHCACV
jgi:hypothetical protein